MKTGKMIEQSEIKNRKAETENTGGGNFTQATRLEHGLISILFYRNFDLRTIE